MTGHLITQIPDPMVRLGDHTDVGSGMNKRLGGDNDLRVIEPGPFEGGSKAGTFGLVSPEFVQIASHTEFPVVNPAS